LVTVTPLSVPGASEGTVAATCVLSGTETPPAATPPILTVAPERKFAPEINAVMPPEAGPDFGVIADTTGAFDGGVGVTVGVLVAVNVGVRVKVAVVVAVEVEVEVAVRVCVEVALGVIVEVRVRVAVKVGVGVATPPETATLSIVTEPSTVLSPLLSDMPTKTFVAMLIVSEPTSVQATPSAELYALKAVPARVIFTQYGATTSTPEVVEVLPPVVTRRWKTMPLPGVSAVIACFELVPRVSRIMTPPLAHGLVFWMLDTRPTIVPSPLNG
jgi:hypothetical protein